MPTIANQFELLLSDDEDNKDNDDNDDNDDDKIIDMINITKKYYDMYKCISKCINPDWLCSKSNIPDTILHYMGTHELDIQYNNIDTINNNNIDYVLKASIWHMGNMIYNNDDCKEKIKFNQLINIYILFSHKIKKYKFLELYKNKYIDSKTLLNIYVKSNKKTAMTTLPEEALINSNVDVDKIFDKLKQLFNINIVTLSSLELSEHDICKHEENNSIYRHCNQYTNTHTNINDNWRNYNNKFIKSR
tara:strand:+ start:416 stop:1156 length:741 start_codon:yes stop_codon:yes gene_type:complete